MPTTVLPPNQNLHVVYAGTQRGVAKVYIEASAPISIYVTTPDGVLRFRSGQGVDPVYDGAEDVEVFEARVQLPRNTEWCLLIINRERGEDWDDARAVHYEVQQK